MAKKTKVAPTPVAAPEPPPASPLKVTKPKKAAPRRKVIVLEVPTPPMLCEVLKQKLEQYKLTPARFAQVIKAHHGVVHRALSGGTISAETAMRLSIAFKTTPQYWLALQAERDIWNVMSFGAKFLNDIEVVAT